MNPFIQQTANDYDISYDVVKVYYDKHGATAMFYEELEVYLKQRVNGYI